MTSNKFPLFLLLLFPVTLAIYWPGLSGVLMLDDGPQITPILNGITADNWRIEFKQYVLSNSGHLNRPVSMASFIFNAIFFGKDLWYWKLTNVILHFFCGLSAFLFTRFLLTIDNRFETNRINLISLTVAFFWLVHPLQVSTVLYLVQRMAILSTLFIFAGLSCFAYAVIKAGKGEPAKPYLIASGLLFFPLAILSKESGVLYPVFILLTNQFFRYKPFAYNEYAKKSLRPFLIIMWLIVLAGIISFLYLFDNIIIEGYRFRQFTVIERLLTEPRVLFLYLYQIAAPLPSQMGFFHDDIVISSDLFNPITTLFSIIGIFSLTIALMVKFKNLNLFAFGMLFFLASHLLESTFLPLEIAFEHRNYIGIWGVVLAIVYVCFTCTKRATIVAIIIGGVLSGLTLYRAAIWGDSNRMYPFMLSAHPNSLRLKIIFAEAYKSAKQYDRAIDYLKDENGLGVSLQRLDIECAQTKSLKTGALLKSLTRAEKIGTYEMEGIINLANLGLDNDCIFDKAEFVQFINSIMLLPIINNVAEQKILLYKAHYHHALNHIEPSLNTLELSFLKDINNPIPLFLKIDWLIEMGRYEEAKNVFIKAQTVSNDSWYDYSEFVTHATAALSHK